MGIKTIRIECPDCHGNGYTEETEHFGMIKGCVMCGGSEDSHYDYEKIHKGKGYIKVKFEVLKEKCEYCAGTGKVECETIEYGTGFFGEYRKIRHFKKTCRYCLGERRQLIQIFKSQCPNCKESGRYYYWQKGLFGNEYKKEKMCETCSGKGCVDKKSGYIYSDGDWIGQC